MGRTPRVVQTGFLKRSRVEDTSPRKKTVPPSSVNRFKVLEIEECSDTDSDEEITLETVEETPTPRKKKKVSGKPKNIQSEWTKKSELKAWTLEWI